MSLIFSPYGAVLYGSENKRLHEFIYTLWKDGFTPSDLPNQICHQQAVFEYIEVFYNRERLYSSNGYMSPVDYELQLKAA